MLCNCHTISNLIITIKHKWRRKNTVLVSLCSLFSWRHMRSLWVCTIPLTDKQKLKAIETRCAWCYSEFRSSFCTKRIGKKGLERNLKHAMFFFSTKIRRLLHLIFPCSWILVSSLLRFITVHGQSLAPEHWWPLFVSCFSFVLISLTSYHLSPQAKTLNLEIGSIIFFFSLWFNSFKHALKDLQCNWYFLH